MRYCRHCGNEIFDDAVLCVHCGCRVSRAITLPEQKIRVNSAEYAESPMAESAKICGIVSLFIGWFVLGITAIILALMSKDDQDAKMSPSAKTGLICGMISTVLSLVIFAIGIYALVEFGSSLF